MVAYMRFVQSNLINSVKAWVYDNYSVKSFRSMLKTDTLYVPEHTFISWDLSAGQEAEQVNSLLAKYGGPYKYVSNKELVNMIKSRPNDKPLFILEYVENSNSRFLGVLDVQSGTVAFRRYSILMFKLKPKDFQGIVYQE